MPKKPTVASVHLLHVRLADIDPPIWRDLLIPGDATLSTLHAAIQAALPWAGGHLHAFRSGRASYTDTLRDADSGRAEESRFTISDVLPRVGMKATYEYDFGDCWIHEIRVKEILLLADWTVGRCVGGARACPPEDCGGAPVYEDFLAALSRKNHARHKELNVWLSSYRKQLVTFDARFKGPFDPEAFDVVAADAAVARATRRARAS